MKSRVGLKLTKFNSLLHMGYFIREYRDPLNVFEINLEEFLKHFVKKVCPNQNMGLYLSRIVLKGIILMLIP